jgi:hypothetical protein
MASRRPGPALVLLLVAPVLGEGLSTATPPLELLLPWNLAIFVSLYGGGALLCREVARRHGFGLLGLCLLGAAYAVYEEALVDRFWFTPDYWAHTGLHGYSAVWHVNLLLATHLTIFHVTVSIGASVFVVERLFPERRETPWVGRRGLTVATVAFVLVLPAMFSEDAVDLVPQLLVASSLMAALVWLAFRVPREPRRPGWTPPGVAWVAFACTGAHFVLTYAVRSTGLPWPIGLLVVLAPVALGVALLHRADGMQVMSGVLGFFCLLCVAIGLFGRYDTTLLGVVAALGLIWLRRRTGRTTP